jgi:hypothetical protein
MYLLMRIASFINCKSGLVMIDGLVKYLNDQYESCNANLKTIHHINYVMDVRFGMVKRDWQT